jgi:predicted ester cyclase
VSSTDLEVAGSLYHAFDAGDVTALDDLLAPDLVDHNPAPGTANAIEGMRSLVAAVRDGFTNPRHEVLYQSATTDGWVVTQWRMTGTHTGPWFGAPATGRDVSFAGIDLVRVVDGRIVEIRHVEELFQLQAQLAI